MEGSGLMIGKKQILSILIANAILWAAAIILTRNTLLGGTAVVALASIASLAKQKRPNRTA